MKLIKVRPPTLKEVIEGLDFPFAAFLLFVLALAGPIVCTSWVLAVWFSVTVLQSIGVL